MVTALAVMGFALQGSPDQQKAAGCGTGLSHVGSRVMGSIANELMPLSVVDAISSTNPRVIDDARARKLSNDLKRCTYYETCATYGLNVERVFQDGKCLAL